MRSASCPSREGSTAPPDMPFLECMEVQGVQLSMCRVHMLLRNSEYPKSKSSTSVPTGTGDSQIVTFASES